MVCVFGSTTMSLAACATCRNSPGPGVGAGIGVGVGVGDAVGVGEGEGSDAEMSEDCTRKSCPPVVQKAMPFAPQRMAARTRPRTPAIVAVPTGTKVCWSNARIVTVALVDDEVRVAPLTKKVRPTEESGMTYCPVESVNWSVPMMVFVAVSITRPLLK